MERYAGPGGEARTFLPLLLTIPLVLAACGGRGEQSLKPHDVATRYLLALVQGDTLHAARLSVEDAAIRPTRFQKVEATAPTGRPVQPIYFFDTQKHWERMVEQGIQRIERSDSLVVRLRSEMLALDLDQRIVLARYHYNVSSMDYVRESNPIIGRKSRVERQLDGVSGATGGLPREISAALDSLVVWTQISNALRLSAHPRCVPFEGATWWSSATAIVTVPDPATGIGEDHRLRMNLVRVPKGRWIVYRVRLETE